eukprot:m.200954 g.200954  ORF g.200954 m.200954 type:complete len:340 (-) comp21273_c0_seq1:50-1069(-)
MADAAESPSGLIVLLLCNGLDGDQLTEILTNQKRDSTKIGSHKRRAIFWDAYAKLVAKATSLQGPVHAMLQCRVSADDGGNQVDVVQLTKRQRGMITSGGVDILGRKLRPADAVDTKLWAMVWSEQAAQAALDDLMDGEPCVYITPDAVFVATRLKRVSCQNMSGPLKSVKDAEKFVKELAPDKPLKSVSFSGHQPPTINGYNVLLAGPSPLAGQLPKSIGYVNSLSVAEIYEYFLSRRNDHLVGEAEKLIAQMLSDVARGLVPIISASSKKDAALAYKNGLMKRVFVHESMAKFIKRVAEDGQVELNIIRGNVDDTKFGQFGSLVFELYYRVDLTTFG